MYAALFENGATWTFTGQSIVTPPVDMGPQTKSAMPDAICTSAVEDLGGGTKRAKVTCKSEDQSPFFGMAPGGTFVMTDAGVWWGADLDPAKLVANEMLVAKVAADHSTEIKDPDMDGAGITYHAKSSTDGAYCFGVTMVAGDEGGWEMCMSAAKGIISGSAFNAGATTSEVKYTRK